MTYNVLVIGSGGREHAIVDALKRSESVGRVYCAPGNAGINTQATPVEIPVTDIDNLARFATDACVNLTVVGPEVPLAAGIVDEFRSRGLRIFGPTKSAAQIEASKAFAKDLMARYGIPTAASRTFEDFDQALEYVLAGPERSVIKYDGLAAGKGVVVAQNHAEAEAALRNMLLEDEFGKGRVVVEEFLDGPEFSFMCLVNGAKVYPLAIARDHKRAYDNDRGPNTGGMGAYSPVPFVTDEIRETAMETIMKPVAKAMVEEGTPFSGVLYGGLILNNGVPKVIEFNARFGDPETEVVLPRMKSDFYKVLEAVLDGKDIDIEWDPDTRLGIVLAAEGYPGSYQKGIDINGLEETCGKVYHMGTKSAEGKLVSNGGRVLMVTASGKDLSEARTRALKDTCHVAELSPGLFHRNDIGAAETTNNL